jgi:ribosomal small subunit protein bTHX
MPWIVACCGAGRQAFNGIRSLAVGKGDKRSKRGKIFRGTKGKSRPKPKNTGRGKAPPRPKAEKKPDKARG